MGSGTAPNTLGFFSTEPKMAAGDHQLQSQIAALAEWLRWADAVVVGAGSGLSSAGGCNHYHSGGAFSRGFSGFEERYGFSILMDGYYHMYSSNEEEWGYLASYLSFMIGEPPYEPYVDLAAVLQGKPHFVLTTNIDAQVTKVFPENDVWTFQGDARFLQCCQPCGNELFEAEPVVRQISTSLDEELRCPTDLLPRCPYCHRIMRPWVRDETFLEGTRWNEGRIRYEEFLRRHLIGGEKVLFLELGVGDMTPTVIKLPFWQMTSDNCNARYCSVNIVKANAPEQLGDRGLAVAGNLAEVLRRLRASSPT